MNSAEQTPDVRAYHQRTKHRPGQYAAGPQTIDWDNQPDPFRTYQGAPLRQLPLVADQLTTPYARLWDGSAVPPRPVNDEGIALLLEISLALSAWKQHGSARWSLRCNPSSGNLHPTEAYVIAVGVAGLDHGVYHYRADLHALEQRCTFAPDVADPAVCTTVDAVVDATLPAGLWLGLSSVHWREAWKYGERAYRYCQHDVGHALAGVSLAAAALGWQAQIVDHCSDSELAQLLGIDRHSDYPTTPLPAEREHPDLLIHLRGGVAPPAPSGIPARLLALARAGTWAGSANVLDRQHFYDWPIIDSITTACAKPAADDLLQADKLQTESLQTEKLKTENLQTENLQTEWPPCRPSSTRETAAHLFRRRRSAQAFDGYTVIKQRDFYTLLDHCLPRLSQQPWAAMPRPARVHLLLFVHRVEGLKPGLYCLPRHSAAQPLLQAAMRPEFIWEKPDSAPVHIPLYQLMAAKAERTATQLSCLQAIAGTSAFSLGMLAEFSGTIARAPWHYRELFWESGAIGQILYTEAEAAGLQGTGIGCFFDDSVHDLLGLQNDDYQSLYHFTVGGGVTDQRIISLPPYTRR